MYGHHSDCSVLWYFHTSCMFIIQIFLYSWHFHTSYVSSLPLFCTLTFSYVTCVHHSDCSVLLIFSYFVCTLTVSYFMCVYHSDFSVVWQFYNSHKFIVRIHLHKWAISVLIFLNLKIVYVSFFIFAAYVRNFLHIMRSDWVVCWSVKMVVNMGICRGHRCLSLVSVVCCQVEVSATGRSLAQRIFTVCDVVLTECDFENLSLRRPRPTRSVELWKKKNVYMG